MQVPKALVTRLFPFFLVIIEYDDFKMGPSVLNFLTKFNPSSHRYHPHHTASNITLDSVTKYSKENYFPSKSWCFQYGMYSLHGNNAMNSYVSGGQSPNSHPGRPCSFYRNPHVVCGKRSCTGTGFFFRSSPVSIISLMFYDHLHINTILFGRTSGWRNAAVDVGDFWVGKYLHVSLQILTNKCTYITFT